VEQAFWMFMAFFYGTLTGSYLNMLTYRLRRGISMWTPARSFCDHCGKTLGVFDLIPVLSFFIHKGKSGCCGKKLSPVYPAVELFSGLVFVAAALI